MVIERQTDAPRPSRKVAPQAPFLAHLIASAKSLPQFCDKRRADPLEAEAAYQDAIKRFGK